MSADPVGAGAALDVRGLERAFGGLQAVDGLGFAVGDGEIMGLLGPNGSGKTTALNLISGQLKPDGGSIRLRGREIAGLPAWRVARAGVARTFQLVRVFGRMSVRENVVAGCFASRFAGRAPPASSASSAHPAPSAPSAPPAGADVDALLEKLGLAALASRPAASLTYIEQKRVELARALAATPDLLLLDEWLAGLNPSELNEGIALIRSLRRPGLSILLVEHVMDAVRALCDRCVVMNAGRRIAEGTPAAVLADPDVIRAYLGDDDADGP